MNRMLKSARCVFVYAAFFEVLAAGSAVFLACPSRRTPANRWRILLTQEAFSRSVLSRKTWGLIFGSRRVARIPSARLVPGGSRANRTTRDAIQAKYPHIDSGQHLPSTRRCSFAQLAFSFDLRLVLKSGPAVGGHFLSGTSAALLWGADYRYQPYSRST